MILIGGTGCTGKTVLASRLMQDLGIPYFPLDHLMMAIYRGIPNCGFDPMDDQFVLGERMWPIIKALIMTNIENGHHVILEGVQILPQLLDDFPPDYLDSSLALFIFFSERYINDHIEDKIIKFRSAIEEREDIEDITAANMICWSRRLKKQCVLYKRNFIEIDSDFEAGMAEARNLVIAHWINR